VRAHTAWNENAEPRSSDRKWLWKRGTDLHGHGTNEVSEVKHARMMRECNTNKTRKSRAKAAKQGTHRPRSRSVITRDRRPLRKTQGTVSKEWRTHVADEVVVKSLEQKDNPAVEAVVPAQAQVRNFSTGKVNAAIVTNDDRAFIASHVSGKRAWAPFPLAIVDQTAHRAELAVALMYCFALIIKPRVATRVDILAGCDKSGGDLLQHQAANVLRAKRDAAGRTFVANLLVTLGADGMPDKSKAPSLPRRSLNTTYPDLH
jgi:hypothetical protein